MTTIHDPYKSLLANREREKKGTDILETLPTVPTVPTNGGAFTQDRLPNEKRAYFGSMPISVFATSGKWFRMSCATLGGKIVVIAADNAEVPKRYDGLVCFRARELPALFDPTASTSALRLIVETKALFGGELAREKPTA